MNNLLIFPPQWSPLSPHSALTLLAANLRANGYDVNVRDLNIEFYNYILTSDYLEKTFEKINPLEDILKEQVAREYSSTKKLEEYSQEFNINASKFLQIRNLKQKDKTVIENILNLLPYAIRVMKDKEEFYSLDLFSKALILINQALNIISLPYFPSELSMHDYMNPVFKFNFDEIKKYCFDRSLNMFYDFYEQAVPSILDKNHDLIGISISSYSQFIPGLTLAALLKSGSDAHVNIGGNYISRITDTIAKYPEFFELFAHSVIFEEGERPLEELVKCLDSKLCLDQVSSLIYPAKSGEIKVNPKAAPLKFNEAPIQDLTGFNFNDYLMPEIVLPIHASRGCYWKKCTFCDHDFGQTYNVKDVDKLINEIKELQDKYGISHFEFIDEAISAPYLKKMSEKILEAGLKINWYCNARLESNLTKDILELARQAGLRMILWGYESGSRRIMELINKGVDTDKRLDILKAASDADIWNFAYIFFGFPTETEQDAMDTVDAVCNNTDVFHAYGRSIFSLGKHALMKLDPEKFGITNLSLEEEPFSSNCSYNIESSLSKEEQDQVIQMFLQKSITNYPSTAWMYITYRETLFLYICKYGADAVKTMKSPF
jgi:hypothetical protein